MHQCRAGVSSAEFSLTMALKGCIKEQCVCRCQSKRVTAPIIAYSSMEDSLRRFPWELVENCDSADVTAAQACLSRLGLHCRQSCMWWPAHHLQVRE